MYVPRAFPRDDRFASPTPSRPAASVVLTVTAIVAGVAIGASVARAVFTASPASAMDLDPEWQLMGP